MVAGAALALAGVPAGALAAFPASPPNDPLFDASPLPNATNEQWDLASPAGGFDRGISVDRAWRLSTGEGVAIADIDLGVDPDHPDLAGRWLTNPGETGTDAAGRDRRSNGRDDDANGYVDDWRGYDFYARDADPRSDTRASHGTQVAGVLGAATDNGVGVAGIAPGAAILPVRTADNILHQSGRLAEGIVYAADRRAGVMSMSLGGDTASGALYRAARYATRKGSVLVAASGNEFHFHHNYPAVLDEVITVGGLNPDTANAAALDGTLGLVATDFGVRAAYSDYGPHLDVVAPTQVRTTEYGAGYTLNWSGTSAATPHVAGVAALVLARGKALGLGLRPREVRQIVNGTADDLADPAKGTAPGWDQLTGYGRVNAFAAVSRVQAGRVPPEVDITSPSWYEPAGRRKLAVRGLVRGRSPARWELEIGEGEHPTSWRTPRARRLHPRPPRAKARDHRPPAPAARGIHAEAPGHGLERQRGRGPRLLLRPARPHAEARLPPAARKLGGVLAPARGRDRRRARGDRVRHLRGHHRGPLGTHRAAPPRVAAEHGAVRSEGGSPPDRGDPPGLRRHAGRG